MPRDSFYLGMIAVPAPINPATPAVREYQQHRSDPGRIFQHVHGLHRADDRPHRFRSGNAGSMAYRFWRVRYVFLPDFASLHPVLFLLGPMTGGAAASLVTLWAGRSSISDR
jgi:hypothetical protein